MNALADLTMEEQDRLREFIGVSSSGKTEPPVVEDPTQPFDSSESHEESSQLHHVTLPDQPPAPATGSPSKSTEYMSMWRDLRGEQTTAQSLDFAPGAAVQVTKGLGVKSGVVQSANDDGTFVVR
jgi:hypothetical protein